LKKTLLFIVLCVFLTSCGWFRNEPEIANVLSKHFNNKLYNKFDTAAYHLVFNERLNDLKNGFNHPRTITAFYQEQENLPVLLTRFYANGNIDSLVNYLQRSKNDGFNPQIFDVAELSSLVNILNANKFKNINEVYLIVADLELRTANALLQYSNCMTYGAVNPKKLFNRYYINNLRPDSLKMNAILNTQNLVDELKQSQPTSKAYIDLKQALAFYRDSLNNENHPDIIKIKLNLERLRWQIPQQTKEIVVVNIPDFSLTWFNNLDTLAHMNVCVGAKRELDYAEKIKIYLKSGKLDDKPKNHETPQLLSVFNSVQVNPVWNIPVSIAQSEIYYQVIKDPYYLSNNNIKVYYKDKEMKNPDTIRWNLYKREKLPFKFKQGSGEGNALGKFKFIFENSSSIYLHDTNNKNGFKLANRAISHGCVRIEDPLKFAELIVNDKYQYDKLRMEISLPPIDTTKMEVFTKMMAKKTDTLTSYQLKPTWFATRKNITVLIAYYTAWAENGKVQFRPDAYNYDEILAQEFKKYMY
jgi:murein L,D-transpeptidase YcbB/YkuD